MKRLFFLFIFVLSVISVHCAPSMFKYNTVEGVEMTFIWDSGYGTTCRVGSNYSQAIDTHTTGTITIPARVKWYAIRDSLTVNKIEKEAFMNCSQITKVVLPESIENVDQRAFSGCTSLREINIPTKLKYVGQYMFENCTSLETITIPQNITGIGAYAFKGCTGLTSISIPSSVTSIGIGSFQDCTSLSSVTLTEGLKTIGANAFEGCTNLTSIVIPDGVTSIGADAFSGCTSLASVIIPNSVTTIEANAFAECTNLTSIIIPNSVTTIGASAFDGCSKLATASIGSGVSILANYTFRNNISLTSVILGQGLTKIGEYCFSGCSQLNSLDMPANLSEIGRYAFENCSSISDINMNDCPVYIGQDAFSGCSKLANIIWSNNIVAIDQYAFKNCSLLSKIVLSKHISSIHLNAFTYCSSVRELIINNGDSELTLNASSSYLPFPLEKLYIGRNIAGSYSTIFTNITTLKKVEFGETIVNTGLFRGCINLSSVIINNGVKNISYNSFKGCTSLNQISFPESLENIYSGAFEGCTALESVDLERTCLVTLTGFSGCTNLKEITLNNSLQTIGGFTGCSSLEYIEIPNSLLSIAASAFEGCTSLKSFTLKKGQTNIIEESGGTIGRKAFYGCSSLETVEIPDHVKSISEDAFWGCKQLSSISLPLSLISIGDRSFTGCNQLLSLELPLGLEEIGTYAFSDCNSLASITIPESVVSIGDYAFYNNAVLQTIYTRIKSPYSVNSAFYRISANAILYVPFGKKNIYANTSGWPNTHIVEEEVKIGDTFTTILLAGDVDVTASFTVRDIAPLSAYISEGTANSLNTSGVQHFEIPSNVTAEDGTIFTITGIDANSLKNSSIKSVSLSEIINYIGEDAFANCTDLSSVSVSWRHPSEQDVSTDNFDSINENATLFVPAGTKERYESIEPWSKFSQIIESSPISIGDMSARYGSHVNVPIILKNDKTIAGLQFKIVLPSGVTVSEKDGELITSITDRTEGMTIMGRKDPEEENSYLFVMFSLFGENIKDSEGAIMNIDLDIADNVDVGRYIMEISDVYLATNMLETIVLNCSNSELTVKDFTIGDVNSDDHVTVTDVISIISYVLGEEPTQFILPAADVNGDGNVTVTDAISVIDKILNNQ